jgi:glutaredoxin
MERKKNQDLYNLNPASITVYGAVWCPDCKRAKQFFGLTPNNELLKGKAELDERGFVLAPRMMSSLSGVLAAGDVRSSSTKQAAWRRAKAHRRRYPYGNI